MNVAATKTISDYGFCRWLFLTLPNTTGRLRRIIYRIRALTFALAQLLKCRNTLYQKNFTYNLLVLLSLKKNNNPQQHQFNNRKSWVHNFFTQIPTHIHNLYNFYYFKSRTFWKLCLKQTLFTRSPIIVLREENGSP